MRLLFQNVPEYLRTDDTQWVYGRWGKHDDAPNPDQPYFFAVRGTLAADIKDIQEVIERELSADPR